MEKQVLRSLSLSYQKKAQLGPAFFLGGGEGGGGYCTNHKVVLCCLGASKAFFGMTKRKSADLFLHHTNSLYYMHYYILFCKIQSS